MPQAKRSLVEDAWEPVDEASWETVDSNIPPSLLESRRAASRSDFEANLPSSWTDRVASGVRHLPGALGRGLNRMSQPETTPEGKPLQLNIGYPPQVSTAPSPDRAAHMFETIEAAIGEHPINTSLVSPIVERAIELEERGRQLPKVLTDFIERVSNPIREPMTYKEGRDFASAAGHLSQLEKEGLQKAMQAQVKSFASAMDEANRGATIPQGWTNLYDRAMREYRLGSGLKQAFRALPYVGATGLTGAGLYEGYRFLGNRLRDQLPSFP